ncbi:MAG: hypothetical protein IKM43_02270 [Clostridia bacterium]|nr:hypothetical protein [Clostridia bacterium]
MNNDILVKMYNAFLKDNKMSFEDIKTQYTEQIDELYKANKQYIPFDKYNDFDKLIELVKLDMKAKFEYEKRLIIKMGMQIGLDAPPRLVEEEIELLEKVSKIKK